MSWECIKNITIKKTRKPHKCVCCDRTIPAGAKNIDYYCGKSDGWFQSSYRCNWCEDNWYNLCDGEYMLDFWECLKYYIFPELFEKYIDCECTDKQGFEGCIEPKLKGDYLIFECEDCNKIWHREYMPMAHGGE